MNINVNNLSKKFNNFLAVDNISFSLDKNKTLGLLGPNGCGKTTTIGMLLGLITPSNGEILINNKNISKSNRNDLLSKMNFASPYIELPKKLTVKQNLEVYGRLYGIKDLKNRVSEISEDLNLNNFLNKKTGELSSGQKNRVSLAKSLINKPEILFLDEPTASLDPDIGDFVRRYIESYKLNLKFLEKNFLSNKYALNLNHKSYATSLVLLAIFKKVSSRLSLPCSFIRSLHVPLPTISPFFIIITVSQSRSTSFILCEANKIVILFFDLYACI